MSTGLAFSMDLQSMVPSPMPRMPRRCSLSPYTTLFRSQPAFRVANFPQQHIGHGRTLQGAQLGGIAAMSLLIQIPADGVLHRSEEHTSELQSRENLVCRLLLEKKNESKMLHHLASNRVA